MRSSLIRKVTMPLGLGFVLSVLWTNSCLSQDIIIKKTKQEIKAVVVEVTDTDIKYKSFGIEGGIVLSIKKSDVFMTIYTNGFREYYDDTPAAPAKDTTAKKKKKGFLGMGKKPS